MAYGLSTACPPTPAALAASAVPLPSLQVCGTSPPCAQPQGMSVLPQRSGWEKQVRNCPSQQKDAAAGGESKLCCQVSSKSSSAWSKLKEQ